MKVVFDNIIFSLQRVGGISVVWRNLIETMRRELPDARFLEYPRAGANIHRQKLVITPAEIVNKPSLCFNPVIEQMKQPKVDIDGPFVFHSSFYRTCDAPGALNVTTVHDFTYHHIPTTLSQRVRRAFNCRAIERSAAVVCVSESTRRDLLRFMPHIAPERVSVIHNGVSECYRPLCRRPYPTLEGWVAFVGGRQSYKNFKFAVDGLAAAHRHLLIIGPPLDAEEAEYLNRRLPGRWRAEALPDDARLNQIYNSVDCLVYPSSNEGFGLPVAEASRAGCPVIALRATSIPEVLGDTPLMMDTLSVDELSAKLKLVADPGVRQAVIESQAVASGRFSWEKMASEYLELYKKLLNFAP